MIEGWEECNLEDYIKLIDYRGRTPIKTESGVRLITAKNVKLGYLQLEPQEFIASNNYDSWMSRGIPKIGDVIFTTEAPLANVAQIDTSEKLAFAQRIIVMQPVANKIDSTFLKYMLLSKNVRHKILEKGTGATVLGIKSSLLKKIRISFPAISEQHRIVAILNEAFVAIDKVKTDAEQNLKNAKELFESYLQDIFENKDEYWVNTTIGETCNLQTGGTPSTSKKEYYQNGTIKWLVSGDINQKIINDCEGRITELGMNNSNTKYLPINSVLIALNGQGKTRGTVAMLKTKATCNQSLVSIFPKDEKSLLPELIFSNLQGRYEEIRKMTGDSGNDRRGLNMPLIRSIRFSYPKKLSEQKGIIKKLDALSIETKKLEAIYQQKINDLEELKKSILQKAFSGELVTEALAI